MVQSLEDFNRIRNQSHETKVKRDMPELFRAFGFVFMFFSLEHAPIHVHVVGKDGDAKYEWNGERLFYVNSIT